MNLKMILLASLGLRRAKPKTRLGRLARYSERVLAFLAVLYVALHAYPQVLFAHSFSQDGITVFARSAMPQDVTDRVAEIGGLVSRSELAEPDQRHRIFVCNNPWLFRLFSPRHGESFAVSVALTGNIFVADADVAQNVARSRRPEFNRHTFTGLAAHEITHNMIRARVGLLGALWIEDWIVEGYSGYIADESSFPEVEGLELLTSGRSEPSRSFRYFLWRKMVEHLVEVRGLAFEEVVAMGGDAERIEADMVAAMRRR